MVTAAVPGNQFRHLALLYHGRGEYLSALRAFVQAYAARGDAVFVAVPRRKAQLVRQELGDDPAHMTLADMAELGRNPARIIPALAPGAPPVLHTLHWDLRKHAGFYSGLDAGPRVRVNGVSASQLNRAPEALRRHSVGHVHLATPLAVGADRRPATEKAGHAVVMGRITPGKGQHLAARLAHECGFDLVLAGPVGPYRQPADLTAAGGTAAANPDVRYWEDEVRPLVDGIRVRWIGTLAGQERNSLVASARVALFPLQWEEPGGTAVVEALALGTPAVGLSRGCLPELVEHGRTGWLAKSPDDLAALVQAAGRIDPRECREQAARRFTPAVMAARYADLYEQLITGLVPLTIHVGDVF